TPGVKHTQTMAGQSMLLSANGSNFGSMFVILEPFADRKKPREVKNADGEIELVAMDSTSLIKRLDALYSREVPEAMITVLPPPPVRGVGRAGGFKLMIEDRESVGSDNLQAGTEKLTDDARTIPHPRTGVVGGESAAELAVILRRLDPSFVL